MLKKFPGPQGAVFVIFLGGGVTLSFVPLTAQNMSYVLPRMAAVNCAAFCYVKFNSFARLVGMFLIINTFIILLFIIIFHFIIYLLIIDTFSKENWKCEVEVRVRVFKSVQYLKNW